MKTAIGVLTAIAGAALHAAGILLIVQAILDRRGKREHKRSHLGR